ncbi:tRNA (adenosine(37)-N6)-dimethylallyltransferase MiaA [Corynebacterium uberis]|uniref:tRNA (adenosine(37)-N6)-dimethylallyltransferase MiaA n=1 Tax=Corynebacterium TaxID=1716 RepID=UPI001D0BD995|nr:MULTISPECIES: tRNA (adenosine(37)-N6)-dimethylallyltransferase MiaA [Corynebacterium]MCZ9308488.1 tRNA (adenosine(37)-N6)-dimethylallyltransferase MiaA [Corynebacterium sp. c6VSa_13]UDL74691.1 tRNA (adenosine(37)-N6)-dimethylallyltransferase MiaA [Corynebacterium uberis]UDL76965.1 tRNA (adenosine(37)-N6)-dimethylallyltransferase MiaA [Corynebacterium uberis]UDL79175.1 tRNA (adenosine(37)-N6)-dimethylallyltransferase MiaA [Corynebacterium uberis]UDL81381.1 tRNA (adenosine(37)-N6)-dimethylall
MSGAYRVDGTITPIAVVGPTASGKSALALALAHRWDGEVVNVDSMQLYRGMDIGTAKLSVAEREGIVHHQLDTLDVTEPASVARYQQSAVADVEDILRRGKTPILAGGSMLYVQSLLDNWRFPPTDAAVRARWQQRLDEVGVAALHAELALKDPAAAQVIEDNDPRRTVRALEVIELTGKPYQASQPVIGAAPRWGTRIIGLATNAQWLNPRIAARTAQMFERGFIDEVRGLVDHHGLRADSTAGRAIGYAQCLQVLRGELSVAQAVEATEAGTRRYVRRQRSWFRRDPRIRWCEAAADPVGESIDWLS